MNFCLSYHVPFSIETKKSMILIISMSLHSVSNIISLLLPVSSMEKNIKRTRSILPNPTASQTSDRLIQENWTVEIRFFNYAGESAKEIFHPYLLMLLLSNMLPHSDMNQSPREVQRIPQERIAYEIQIRVRIISINRRAVRRSKSRLCMSADILRKPCMAFPDPKRNALHTVWFIRDMP